MRFRNSSPQPFCAYRNFYERVAAQINERDDQNAAATTAKTPPLSVTGWVRDSRVLRHSRDYEAQNIATAKNNSSTALLWPSGVLFWKKDMTWSACC